jgi:hypothetical protein
MNTLMVIFLFLGHSNLTHNEDCQIPDNPHVWCYGEKGIRHFNESAPVMFFLNEMSIRYPGVDFVGANFSYGAALVKDMVPGFQKYDKLMRAIDTLKRIGYFGGIVAEYGFVEGADSAIASHFDSDFIRLIDAIRWQTENRFLPCLLQRYEMNGKDGPQFPYMKYKLIIKDKIERLEQHDKTIALFPINEMPSDYYIQGHHFNCAGNKIAMSDAVVIYQFNRYHWKETK